MKNLATIFASLSVLVSAQNKSLNPTEMSKVAIEVELQSFPMAEGMTIPGCLELKWKNSDKSKLPTSVRIKNPFLEDLTVSLEDDGVLLAPGRQLEIEFYEPILKAWRSPLRLVGSSASTGLMSIRHGQTKEVRLQEDFWDFGAAELLPRLVSQKNTRVRLVFNAGGVLLRSAEFNLNAAEQAGADQPATKPADKPPVKDQPSTPTPKGGPR